ncbi:hypothetical protein SCUCBS95973_008479 [Sporothrix curviconia]|uniref:C6 zinc finger domain containing protein n=1 Tax=Sporothrix curviconia TaxID=1260050 RepID=A0ABP0CLW2_9PEZI
MLSMFNEADLGAGDWPMQFDNGNGGNNSNGPASFSLDSFMQMTAVDGPLLTGDAANMLAGLTPSMDTQSPNCISNANTGPTPAAQPAESASSSTGTISSAPFAQRLSKLVVDADLLYGALPSEAAMHAPLGGGENDGAPFLDYVNRPHYSPDKFAKKEFLERVFDITQRLSSAYGEAVPRAGPSADKTAAGTAADEAACEFDNCLHNAVLPGNLAALETAFLESGLAGRLPATSDATVVDSTVVALLMAAHTRLLNILVRILQGIFTCYRLRVASSTLNVAEMQLPDLVIGGSFVPPKGSAALVHAFLLRHLLDTLQSGVDRFLEALEGGGSSSSRRETASSTAPLASRELHIAALQFAVLKERHDATLKHLVAVGMDLASTGLIK